jgi:hypothetical protein
LKQAAVLFQNSGGDAGKNQGTGPAFCNNPPNFETETHFETKLTVGFGAAIRDAFSYTALYEAGAC